MATNRPDSKCQPRDDIHRLPNKHVFVTAFIRKPQKKIEFVKKPNSNIIFCRNKLCHKSAIRNMEKCTDDHNFIVIRQCFWQ